MTTMTATTWKKTFRNGWDDLDQAQRLDRARYVVEEGLNKGHSVAAIVDALKGAQRPLKKTMVRNYLDIYGCAEGAHHGVVPDQRQMAKLRRLYQTKVTDEDLSNYAEELGVSIKDVDPTVARRFLEARQIGAALKGKKLSFSEEDEAKSEEVRQQTSRERLAESHRRWISAFNAGWERTNAFIRFLSESSQDSMKDSTVARKIERMAVQLERQADRFEIGYAKFEAKQKTRKP